MTQERLSSLAVLSIEQEMKKLLDVKDVNLNTTTNSKVL